MNSSYQDIIIVEVGNTEEGDKKMQRAMFIAGRKVKQTKQTNKRFIQGHVAKQCDTECSKI